MTILKAEGVTKRFGGLVAVNDVSLEVEEGEIFGLIGPNGAGKTTFINVISGVYRPEAGSVWYKGRKITGMSCDAVCKLGIARTFQIPRPFRMMTALENVMVAVIFGKPRDHRRHDPRARALELLEFVEFPASPDTPAGSLNTVQLKRLELARALATHCQLLLLDEIAAGLTPAELGDLIALVRRIRDRGVTIITIEHLMRVIVQLCDRLAVLQFGRKIAEGTVQEIMENDKVIEAYLGEKYIL
jgi:branched-chain amino acid transport system ATP-binding protein